MKISYDDFFLVLPDNKRRREFAVTISEAGRFCLNSSLRQEVGESALEIFMSRDYNTVLMRLKEGGLRINKNGYFNSKLLIKEMAEKKISLPAHYIMEWEKGEKIWIGKREQHLIPLSAKKRQASKIVKLEEFV